MKKETGIESSLSDSEFKDYVSEVRNTKKESHLMSNMRTFIYHSLYLRGLLQDLQNERKVVRPYEILQYRFRSPIFYMTIDLQLSKDYVLPAAIS